MSKLFLMIRLEIKIILYLIILSNFINSQDHRVLAKVGSYEITSEEYSNRFDFMPHLNYSHFNIDTIKKEFLYSLIAEKLWAMEAYEIMLDTMPIIKHSLKTLEKLFVKDELYKEKVESKITIEAKDIAKGLGRVGRILNLSTIANSDSGTIFNVYWQLKSGTPLDSVLLRYNLYNKTQIVKYGSLENEDIEDLLYSIKTDEYSYPFKSGDGWFIFKLLNEESDLTIDPSKDHAKNIVIKKIRDRKLQNAGSEFLDSFFINKEITVDRKLFEVLSDNLLKVLQDRVDFNHYSDGSDLQLLEDDIYKVINLMGQNELYSPFVHLDLYPVTITDFLFFTIYQKISFSSLDSLKFKKSLSRIIKGFIENEIICQEGYKLGLNDRSAVKENLAIWKEYYLAEVMMNGFADSVKTTTDSAKKLSDSSGLMVNITEIFTQSLEDIEIVLSELQTGKDFTSLAALYNQREWTKASNGVWGYFDPYMAGEIGRIASELKIGEIYGPIKIKDGFSLIKLIDKKKLSTAENKIVDQDSIKFLKIKLALGKIDDLLNKYTAKLAIKHKVEINNELLLKIEVSALNTFTYRLIGFGGKIAAFPVTIPLYLWYKDFKQEKEIP